MTRDSSLHVFRALSALLAFALAAVAGAQPAPVAPRLANPASQNCVAQGGRVVIEKNPRGEFGVCLFADNLQCEEWALLRGDCRAGGIRVTGYATAAARYCAITGGSYAVTGASNTAQERGSCTLPGGKTCDAGAYFAGTCTRDNAGAAAAPADTIRARFACGGGRSIDAAFVNGPGARVELALSDGRRMTLPVTPSAGGARYASVGDAEVFWNRGDTAWLEERGRTTYAGCATKP